MTNYTNGYQKNKVLFIFISVIAICILTTGSVLAYSIKLKSDGDKEYKNKNYTSALPKYKLSQQWWFPERIDFKLRDRDLHNKLNKAEIMVKSGNYYTKGIDAFNNKKYLEAKKYLSNLVVNDPHYQEAQNLLIIIQKESLPKPSQVLANTKPVSVVGVQEKNNNSSGIDWNEFKNNPEEKLKDTGMNKNQVNQTAPTTTPIPTAFQLNEDDFTYDFNPKTLVKSNIPQKIDFTLTFLKDFDYGQITSITFYLIDETNNINRTPTFMRYMYSKDQNKTINESITPLFNNNEKYIMNKIHIVYKNNETTTINITKNQKYLEIN